MLHNTSRLHLLEQRTDFLNALSTIIEMLLQFPTPEVLAGAPGTSSVVVQQVTQKIVELTQRILDCSHVSLLVVDQQTRIFYPAALAGFSPEQAQRFRAHIAGFRLQDLFIEPGMMVHLETQEVLRVDIMHSPLLRRVASLFPHPIWYVASIQAHHELLGLLGIVFPDADYRTTPEDLALIEAMRKLSALLIELEHQAVERATLISTLQLMNVRLREANTQLEQANTTQSTFISAVGHEFRSALTSIQGFSELLSEEAFSFAEVRNFAADILSDALRLKHMIDDMLDLEQMQAGKMKLRRELLDLNALLQAVEQRFAGVATQHPIRLQLEPTLPLIEGDRERLIQAVSNLLSNAAKYSPAGAPITVRSTLEPGMAHISVRDDGIGIPTNDLERIFVPYGFLAGGTTREMHERGLGLPIVGQIIQTHGGHTWAESTPGQGSTFHFTLPFPST